MRKILPAIAVSLVVGFAAAGWLATPELDIEQFRLTDQSAPGASFSSLAPIDERIRALEQAVSDERYVRQVLQEELWYLSEEMLQLTGGVIQEAESAVVAEPSVAEPRLSRRDEYRRRNSLEGRMDRLVEAGFLPSQASMIVRRESELQMQSLQARYEAERSGDPVDYWRSRSASSETLRQELGDADYERYLTANDRSITISVSSVIDSWPGQAAGLQPGDEIVRYDGERVFSMTDLTRQTMAGTAGQNIVVDIMRDGNPMQIVMPRGPVGITGGRRRW
jgi:hypothetical protein